MLDFDGRYPLICANGLVVFESRRETQVNVPQDLEAESEWVSVAHIAQGAGPAEADPDVSVKYAALRSRRSSCANTASTSARFIQNRSQADYITS